jgi:excisionase family DNA binding protein
MPGTNRLIRLLGMDEAGERLGLKPGTIRAWANARRIASVKLGRRRLIPSVEVDRLIADNLVPALSATEPSDANR